MTLAANIAKLYGQEKEQRNQDGWLTCCRVHGDNKPSLSVQGKGDGDVYVHCHAGCDWKDIKDQFRADGVLPELQSKKKNGEQTKVHTTRSVVPTPAADQVATEVEKASLNWKHAIHDNLSHVKNQNNRGAFCQEDCQLLRWKTRCLSTLDIWG